MKIGDVVDGLVVCRAVDAVRSGMLVSETEELWHVRPVQAANDYPVGIATNDATPGQHVRVKRAGIWHGNVSEHSVRKMLRGNP